MEVEMAKKQTRSSDERLTHPILEELGATAGEGLFAYSVKIVCGKQTETNCCCVAGARPGVYATEVNIQNLNLVQAPVLKFVQPLINSGAVVAREPNFADPATLPKRQVERIILPPLGATMDDCAGKHQQIIVLTCRLRSFAPLGGHTLWVQMDRKPIDAESNATSSNPFALGP
jgi:hypothetical protein